MRNNGFKPGVKHSKETINKILLSKKKKKEETGYVMSEEARKRLSEQRKGRKIKEQTRQKMILSAAKGDKNKMWKGGISGINKSIRACFKYSEWRNSVFKRDNFSCIKCGAGGNINADHYPVTFSDILKTMILEKGQDNAYQKAQEYSLFWDISNGRTLCEKCHIIDHHKIKRKGFLDKPKAKPRLFLMHEGNNKPLTEWSKITGISLDTINHRYNKGMSSNKILSSDPVRGSFIEYKGKVKPLSKWCLELGLNLKLTWTRINMNKWSIEDAFTYPIRKKGCGVKYINKPNNRVRKNNRMIEYSGEVKAIYQWANLYNINQLLLAKRLKYGWEIGKALTKEPQKKLKQI